MHTEPVDLGTGLREKKNEPGKFELYSDRGRGYAKLVKSEPNIDIEISATKRDNEGAAVKHVEEKKNGSAQHAICVGGQYLTAATDDVQKTIDKGFQFADLFSIA